MLFSQFMDSLCPEGVFVTAVLDDMCGMAHKLSHHICRSYCSHRLLQLRLQWCV